jgi:hypothetical protein
MIYIGTIDTLINTRNDLEKALKEDLLKERREAVQDAINNLNKAIFDLNRAIELRVEGFKVDNED